MIDTLSGITVNVGDECAILPPLGETTGQQVAEMKAVDAVQSDIASTAVSGVITGEQLRPLLLYNRNFLALGLLTPETHDVGQGSPLTGGFLFDLGDPFKQQSFPARRVGQRDLQYQPTRRCPSRSTIPSRSFG